MSDITVLADALKAEFKTDVAFHTSMPSKVVAPAVICVPAEEFLMPSTHGAIDEMWEVLVAASWKDTESGFATLRKLSLRVMRTTMGVGGRWRGATGPQLIGKPEEQQVVSINRIAFRYPPPPKETTP